MTFSQKEGGGVSANPKNPYQKKLRWSKKGEGGGLSFLTKSHKKTVFFLTPPLIARSRCLGKFLVRAIKGAERKDSEETPCILLTLWDRGDHKTDLQANPQDCWWLQGQPKRSQGDHHRNPWVRPQHRQLWSNNQNNWCPMHVIKSAPNDTNQHQSAPTLICISKKFKISMGWVKIRCVCCWS